MVSISWKTGEISGSSLRPLRISELETKKFCSTEGTETRVHKIMEVGAESGPERGWTEQPEELESSGDLTE